MDSCLEKGSPTFARKVLRNAVLLNSFTIKKNELIQGNWARGQIQRVRWLKIASLTSYLSFFNYFLITSFLFVRVALGGRGCYQGLSILRGTLFWGPCRHRRRHGLCCCSSFFLL